MTRYRKPYRVKRKKSILRSRLFWRIVLVLVFIGVSFYFIFLSPIFKIKKIDISGNQEIQTEDIKSMIKTGNIFLADLGMAKKIISEKFPQIALIDIERKFPDKIIVRIEERKAVAVFCQQDNCFLIDKEGVIFAPIRNDISNGVIKIQKLDEDGPRPDLRLGDKVLENNLISSALTIESKLKDDFEIAIEEFLVVSNERLNVKTDESWEIYFDPTEDLNWQATKLKAVLEQEISRERRKDLQYIELRFGNLASYK